MDFFSLVEIIEKIHELSFKYLVSYPSDKVSRLTKKAFAINNSAPNNGRGEHWIMIARLGKTYYFADSLRHCPFSQKVWANVSQKTTKN